MKSVRFWREFPLVCGLCVAGGLVIAEVITFFMPEIHESEMVLEVRPLESETAILKEQGVRHAPRKEGERREYEVKAVERLRGRELSGKVVDALQLDRKWRKSREEAIDELKKAVRVGFIRDSSLISIQVRFSDSRDACAIATEIGWHFTELRNGLERSGQQQRLEQADRAIRDQEDRVEERRKVLRTLLRKSHEVDPDKVEWLKSDGSDTNEEAPGDFTKRALGVQTYEDAKKDLDADLRSLAELSAKRAVILARGFTASEAVICHEMPRVADVPVLPDVRFNLGVGMGIGFVLSPFLTILAGGNHESHERARKKRRK
jgi:hypothetical protein